MSEVADGRESEIEQELDRGGPDTVVATRMFLVVGSVVGTMSLVYLLTDDDAGQMMLGVASLLSLVCGLYLYRHRVRGRTAVIDEHHRDRTTDTGEDEGMYLPHASIWPFWIGAAAFLITNGLVLGIWFLVPGCLLLLAGIVGFVRQSRARS